MKQFTTNKILVELTREELEILDACINSAICRMYERAWEPSYIRKVNKIWYELMEIKKSLPF